MQTGTRTYLYQNAFGKAFALLMLAGIAVPSFAFAQTDAIEDASDKKKVEPVFRISKMTELPPAINEEVSVDSATTSDSATASETTQPGDRVASNNVLPARTSIVANASSDAPMATSTNPPEASNSTGSGNATLPSATTTVPVKPAKATITPKPAPHPLDRAVVYAKDALQGMRTEVFDYTALLAKREQINGVVGNPSFMAVKVRCPRTLKNGTKTPFSIYMKFLKPKASAGREVIWVDGHNDGKLIVHEGSGLMSMKKFQLDPTGFLAMKGQRYPIYEAGLENLIVKLIEKAERDRAVGPCVVNYKEGAEINKRPCSLIELVHEQKKYPYEFHKAHVFVDSELQVPVRFAAYDWPTSPGAKPKLIEEYTYYNIKVNTGLTDMDFNPDNPAYKFPRR